MAYFLYKVLLQVFWIQFYVRQFEIEGRGDEDEGKSLDVQLFPSELKTPKHLYM